MLGVNACAVHKCFAIGHEDQEGTFVLYTLDLMKPQAKKFNGVKLGECGAPCFGAALSIHVFRKMLLR
jgi:hypothetical protein